MERSSDPVVIVGAGLAGLCCARRLHEAGVPALVLEADDVVGGRVRTDDVDGFRLDRGFQVLQTAYPEARRVLDYAGLDLRPFEPGAWVRTGGRFVRMLDPWRRPASALSGLFAPIGTLTDKLRVARLRMATVRADAHGRFDRDDRSTIAELRDLGFSGTIIDRLFRPWFGGVFFDRDLETSARFFRFTFAMFALGDSALPSAGMAAIPRQIAAGLPDGSVRVGTRVQSVGADHVVLDDGSRVDARAVVVAVEGPEAARLAGDRVEVPVARSTTCVQFAADRAPVDRPVLMLAGDDDGPVGNVVVPSNVAPSYAPAGQALVSASIVGVPDLDDGALEREVRRQLRGWFDAQVDTWRLLRIDRIRFALPAHMPGGAAPGPTRSADGAIVCGDFLEAPSIQGAMTSGRHAAEAVLESLPGTVG